MVNETKPLVYSDPDKAYEARRAGLIPPDTAADQLVLAARKEKADAAKAARAAQVARSKEIERERARQGR